MRETIPVERQKARESQSERETEGQREERELLGWALVYLMKYGSNGLACY